MMLRSVVSIAWIGLAACSSSTTGVLLTIDGHGLSADQLNITAVTPASNVSHLSPNSPSPARLTWPQSVLASFTIPAPTDATFHVEALQQNAPVGVANSASIHLVPGTIVDGEVSFSSISPIDAADATPPDLAVAGPPPDLAGTGCPTPLCAGMCCTSSQSCVSGVCTDPPPPVVHPIASNLYPSFSNYYGYSFAVPKATINYNVTPNSTTTPDTWDIAIFDPTQWAAFKSGMAANGYAPHYNVSNATDGASVPAGSYVLGFRCENVIENCDIGISLTATY